MTLIDSRAGIGAVWERLAEETGAVIDVPTVVGRLGPPLEHEMAEWFPAAEVPLRADRYRELSPALAVAPTAMLPGAREAVAAVRRHGGRTLVVTAKLGRLARLHLDHLGI